MGLSRTPAIVAVLAMAVAIGPAAAAQCDGKWAKRVGRLFAKDQELRQQAIKHGGKELPKALERQMTRADEASLALVRETLRGCKWPSRSAVGGQAAGMFAVLVVHSIDDSPLQRYALHLLGPQVDKGEADGQMMALLVDKLRVADGRPQVYGTQLDWELNVRPIEDADRVDERRKKVGLPPLAEYVEQVKKLFDSSKSGGSGTADTSAREGR